MIIMVMAIICQTSLIAQKVSADKVPVAVKNSFKAKFPNAVSASWEIEKKDVYEVNFADGKQKESAQFDKSGTWQKTEIGITTAQLPSAVAAAFAKAFPGYKITEAERAETPANKLIYELEAAKGTSKAEVQMLPNGDIIARENIAGKD